MLTHLADISVRSLLLAISAAIGLWILRRRTTAAFQHAIWTMVVFGMLALFAFGQVLPRVPLRILNSPAISIPATPTVFDSSMPIVETPAPPATIPTNTPRPIDWSAIAVYAYGAVAFAFLAQFAIGMFLVRKLLASARPVQFGFYESERVTVPVTVGWLQPVILLPLEWRVWSREKVDAVLAHEGAHVRRRDGLVAALAHVNRCIFWFHPLAWMLERKLTLLAEQACDESCVAALGNRNQYAHLLLEMALIADLSQGRLRYHVLTMASGSHIRQRIDSLLQEGRTFSPGLTWTGWLAVMLCGIPIVLCAGAVELDRVPALTPLEMPRLNVPAPPVMEQPTPILLAQSRSVPSPTARPEFEVASIRPAAPRPPSRGGRGRGGGSGVGTGCGAQRLTMDESLVTYRCVPLQALIAFGYGLPQHDVTGPDWLMDTRLRFDVEAKLPEGASKDRVPEMFRSLLEDRFGLAVHRGSQEQQVNALVVDKGGLKLKEASPDSSAPVQDPNAPPCPPQSLTCSPHITNSGGEQVAISPGSPGVPQRFSSDLIGTALVTHTPEGRMRIDAPNTTLAGLAELLQPLSFQPVVDKTGLKGRYKVLIETFVDRNALMAQARAAATAAQTAGGPPNSAANAEVDAAFDKAISDTDAAMMKALQSALKKVGLRLEPQKGPVETLVVDHAEKTPTGN